MLFKQIILSNISLFISSRAIHIHIPYCYKSNAPNDPHKYCVVSREGRGKRFDLNLYDIQSEYIYAEFEWSLKGTIMGARDQDPKHLDSFFPQKRRMSRHDFIDLKWDLVRILNRLQCLPMAGVTKGYYKGSTWMKDKKGFQISVNPNHYHLKKTLVLKGSRRSRMKKGLKRIPQQAKDFANITHSHWFSFVYFLFNSLSLALNYSLIFGIHLTHTMYFLNY